MQSTDSNRKRAREEDDVPTTSTDNTSRREIRRKIATDLMLRINRNIQTLNECALGIDMDDRHFQLMMHGIVVAMREANEKLKPK